MSSDVFGASVLRKEDDRLLRGAGQFVADLPGRALGVAFVRSPHAHAKIESIDVSRAIDAPGLIGLYTYEDLPAKLAEPIPVIIPHPGLTHPRTTLVLANDVVRFVGEPVAMVVATDRYAAEDIAGLVDVDYRPRAPVVGIPAAAAAEQLVHEGVAGNRAGYLLQEVGDAEAAIAAAPHRLTFQLEIERSASTPLECRGVFARWNASDRTLRVYSATQMPSSLRVALASYFDLPLPAVEVIAPDVGGGFGVKGIHPWPEELLVTWAGIMLERPVAWIEDRREHFIAATHERGQIHDVDVGFDDEGHILGLDVSFLHDNGAYTPYGITLPIITATQLPGPYKLGAYRVEFTSLYTNTCPVTPYRGAGRPQGAFCMERTIDRIAQYLGRDRAEVRAANFIQPEEMPYDVGLIFQDGCPTIYDSGDFPESLRLLKELIDWDGFPSLQAEARRSGRRLGIGIGCYVEGTGLGPYEGGHVVVETSGRVLVSVGLASQGQGHETVFAQIVAHELGVPIADVTVVGGDTRHSPGGVGTYASRAAVMSGNAVAQAARQVRAKALRLAADALEANADDLEIVDGVIQVRGSPRDTIPLRTVAVLANPLRYAFDEEAKMATQFASPTTSGRAPVEAGDIPSLESRDFFSPVRSTFANGMHAAIVETDPATADIKILRYAVVHDCGRLINPMIVEGQIHGGVAQGIAGALYERMVYDEHGQLLNASFMDFLMPYATEIPRIDIAHLETPSTLNPLGIKGAGEAGVIPVAAVLAAAIEDAEGLEISAMPLAPSDLFELRRRPVGRSQPGAAPA